MSDVAKPAIISEGAVARMPHRMPPILPDPDPIGLHPKLATIAPNAGKTVFDGDEYSFFDHDPSFDIEGAAARVLAAYDRNDDGAIDLGSGVHGFLLGSETSRTAGSGRSSIEQLARYADEAGNGDGSATVEEIANVVRMFDQDSTGDGRLSGSERETFLEVFDEEFTRFKQFRHVDPFPFPRMPQPYHSTDRLVGDQPEFRGP